ncbi:MAG: retroviral-like aspartic protease family protein [Clostridiales bacterium]|nr:retroviral-like aspartic protease family protein [Clostridiales bacterium]
MLDTGASITTISRMILLRLGYSAGGKITTITTGSGQETVAVYSIPKVKIGLTELTDVEVYAHDFPEESYVDGVLGMNILENFNFAVNLDENIIKLERRSAYA